MSECDVCRPIHGIPEDEIYNYATDLQAALAEAQHGLKLIEPHTARGITDCSTPLHIRVQNIVQQLEKAERERDELRAALAEAKEGAEGIRRLWEKTEADCRRAERERDTALAQVEGHRAALAVATPAAKKLRETADRQRALLRDILAKFEECPLCHGLHQRPYKGPQWSDGHTPDCRLAAELE